VERGKTIHDPEIAGAVMKIADALRAPGVINVQCFCTETGPVFTEINPRFGGGYPLAHAAGARFPEMIVAMLDGKEPAEPGSYHPDMVMMRYDQAVYRPEKELVP